MTDETINGFLPINHADMLARGWEQPDFVYVCGDAYVDHPSFGAAIISRVLEAKGFWVIGLLKVIVEAVKNIILNAQLESRLRNS